MLARRVELMQQTVDSERAADRALVVACDVRDAGSVREAVAATVTRFGAIDLAIANAGVSSSRPAVALDLPAAEMIMATNFYGMLYLFHETVPAMLARGNGQFAGVASLAGLRGLPTSSVYSASKAAMQNFLECARVELRKSGVGVTIVNPGFVRTEMTRRHRFRMPFLMEADQAARITIDGIEAGRKIVEFPFPTAMAMRIARLLPAFLFDPLFAPYAAKRKNES